MRWDVDDLCVLQAKLDKTLRAYEAQCYLAQRQVSAGRWHEFWGDEAKYAEWFRKSAVRRIQSMIDFAHGKDVQVLQNEPKSTLDDENGAAATGAGAGA